MEMDLMRGKETERQRKATKSEIMLIDFMGGAARFRPE